MILPRAQYLTEDLSKDRNQPVVFYEGLIHSLPDEITAITGPVHDVRFPPQGLYLVIFIEAGNGAFVLKVGRGAYRSQELLAEHNAMQFLAGSSVPVPRSLAFVCRDDLCYQLREFCAGEPTTDILYSVFTSRIDAIISMGKTLAEIHKHRLDSSWTWKDWITASLEEAEENLAGGVLDPDEFTADAPPDKVFDWLQSNVPAEDSVCLLHGDYRPKNILWRDNRIVGVIDWAFTDIGDPYYDLSIINWYIRDNDWKQFISAYGLSDFDNDRLQYYAELQKFLNV